MESHTKGGLEDHRRSSRVLLLSSLMILFAAVVVTLSRAPEAAVVVTWAFAGYFIGGFTLAQSGHRDAK